jgi:AcrR family transcriptional regulator
MATARTSDEHLAELAAGTFRTFGYEGASLNRLAAATGLEKASLYYRYPGGKEDILMAAVGQVGRWFEANIVAPLAGDGLLADRLAFVIARMREFYADGSTPCMLDTLSLRSGNPETDARLHAALRPALEAWLQAFAAFAMEAGLPEEEARSRAEQAVAAIEGGLVLSRVQGESRLFLQALESLPMLLTRL